MPMPIERKPTPPAPRPEPKGILGGEPWREFGKLRYAVRDDKYSKVVGQGYSRQWSRDERAALIDEVKKLRSGNAYLKKEDIPQTIEQMRKAKWPDEKIKMFESLVKDK